MEGHPDIFLPRAHRNARYNLHPQKTPPPSGTPTATPQKGPGPGTDRKPKRRDARLGMPRLRHRLKTITGEVNLWN